MGLFRRSAPAPVPTPLPIPRASVTWPKAQPKAAVDYGPPSGAPAAPPPLEAPKPSLRDAGSVVAAFASWKQVTAARTASATAVADASSVVVAPKAEDSGPVTLRTEPTPAPIILTPAPSLILPRPSAPLLRPPAPPLLNLGEPIRRPEPPPPPKVEAPPPARREDPVMYVYRAAAKQARGEHEAAIADLSRAIELDPTCTVAWAGRAISLEATGDLAGAKRDYSKSIEIELRQEIARQSRPL